MDLLLCGILVHIVDSLEPCGISADRGVSLAGGVGPPGEGALLLVLHVGFDAVINVESILVAGPASKK